MLITCNPAGAQDILHCSYEEARRVGPDIATRRAFAVCADCAGRTGHQGGRQPSERVGQRAQQKWRAGGQP